MILSLVVQHINRTKSEGRERIKRIRKKNREKNKSGIHDVCGFCGCSVAGIPCNVHSTLFKHTKSATNLFYRWLQIVFDVVFVSVVEEKCATMPMLMENHRQILFFPFFLFDFHSFYTRCECYLIYSPSHRCISYLVSCDGILQRHTVDSEFSFNVS